MTPNITDVGLNYMSLMVFLRTKGRIMPFGNSAKFLNRNASSVLMQPTTAMKYLRLPTVSSTRLISFVKIRNFRIPVHS